MKIFFSNLITKLNTGRWPLVVVLVVMLTGSVGVYQSPRSLIAFLILMSSSMLLYFMNIDVKVKIFFGVLLTLVILPVLGIRNIFYL